MIPLDSPLRNPPDSLPPNQKVAIDGLRYAADMVALSADRLYSALSEISEAPREQPSPAGSFARCFSDAWSVVDNLWRLNLLVLRAPGLKRTPEIKIHLRALRAVEPFRHEFQHLDERIVRCAQQRLPLLGTLTWAHFPEGGTEPGRLFLMIPGALRPGNAPFLNPAGKPIRSAIDLVTLSAFGSDVEISTILRRVSQLLLGLDSGFRTAVVGKPGGGADALVVAQFVPRAPAGGAV